MSGWVSFSQVKKAAPIGAVLERYGWRRVRQRGDQLERRCPIHRGERDDAFHADLGGNGFHCFSCGAKGSVLDLVAALESCPPRQAALLLQRWFDPAAGCATGPGAIGVVAERERIRKKDVFPPPLPFRLNPIGSSHPYLRQRGIAPGTATYFGVGHYPGRGIMRDRIVIPIHDQGGQLVAYAGRAVQQTGPKYLLPPGFAKSQVLFNLHRAATYPGPAIILVEGYFDCMKVHQAGFPRVAALMGCCLSARQQHLLVSHAERIVLMLDADLAGMNASRQIAHRLSALRPVHLAALPPGAQPDQMSSDNIKQVLSDALGHQIYERGING